MSALARVLREEYRKSFELSSNIINIFLRFSAYKIFHKMLIDHKVSSKLLLILIFVFKF